MKQKQQTHKNTNEKKDVKKKKIERTHSLKPPYSNGTNDPSMWYKWMANTKPSGMDVHDFCCNASNGSVSINQLSERKKKEIKELKIQQTTNNKQQTTNNKQTTNKIKRTRQKTTNTKTKQHQTNNKQTTNNTTNNKSKSRTRTYLEWREKKSFHSQMYDKQNNVLYIFDQ